MFFPRFVQGSASMLSVSAIRMAALLAAKANFLF
jgi:hypothetical protein